MSSRASIVYIGPIHIYAETNSWDEAGKFTICISDISYWPKCEYNGDVKITRAQLKEIHEQLSEFLREEPY